MCTGNLSMITSSSCSIFKKGKLTSNIYTHKRILQDLQVGSFHPKTCTSWRVLLNMLVYNMKVSHHFSPTDFTEES